MSAITTFDHVWAWRKSCKPFTDAECYVSSTGPVAVTESHTKRPEYGIQLNVTTKDYYWPQNILLFLSDPPQVIWWGYVLDPGGKPIHSSNDVMDFPFNALGPYKIILGMARQDSSTYRTVQVLDGSGKIVFNPPQKELYIDLDKEMVDASLNIVGLGDCSQATFTQGAFDIELFLHDKTDLQHPLDDLTADGSNELQAYNLPAPSICGRFSRSTCENSNLIYEIQSAQSDSAFLKAHLPIQ